jgi:hypothetical protein
MVQHYLIERLLVLRQERLQNSATTRFGDTACVVKEDANHMTDIFPIVFYNATVGPGSNAVQAVMTKSK